MKLFFLNSQTAQKIILFIFLLSLMNIFSFPKNIFLLLKDNFENRNVSKYGYCYKESIGFLHFLKKKYKDTNKFELYNFNISPDPKWYLGNLKNKNSNNYKILLGYFEDNLIEFNKKENQFISKKTFKNINNVEKLIFNNESLNSIENFNFNIYLSLDNFNFKKLVFKSDKILVGIGENSFYFDTNFFDNNLSNFKIIVEIDKKNDNQFINNLSLVQKNKFKLDDYEILENFKSCYLISKL